MTFRNPGLFFGHSVSQSSPLEFRPLLLGTTLTAAVLGPEQGSQDIRSILLVKVGASQSIAIASFVSGVCENATLNLAFEEGANVTFTVRGPGVIHLSGRHFFDGESTTSRDALQPEDVEENDELQAEHRGDDSDDEEEGDQQEQQEQEQEQAEGISAKRSSRISSDENAVTSPMVGEANDGTKLCLVSVFCSSLLFCRKFGRAGSRS